VLFDPTIHIVTAADDAYIPHVAAMLHSLLTSSPDQRFFIHFLHRPNVSINLLEKLEALCRHHQAQFESISVSGEVLGTLPIKGRYTEEAWYRIVLPSLLPQTERVLWLDADVIVLSSVTELWATPLDDKPIAACPNALLWRHAEGVANIGIEDRRLYFNSGVMLLNLKQLRDEKSEAKLRAEAQRISPWIKMADQDVLNCVYHRRWVRLPLAWNVLAHAHINVPETIRVHGSDEYAEAMRAPRIIHFTGPESMKPWMYGCSHPQRDIYLRHRRLAGWPPPDYVDKNPKSFLLRQVPLRARAFFGALARRNFGESMSYLREW
jgi:lipopolysaccharide biosynthesis glycosyltransferase